jgi:transcriptional regulator with XRE-family HTH domain
LRSRRERLTPADVGLPNGFRRRTPGLRREEVAMLADVGTTWYTWLEQGRDVRPSNELLSALAEALRLDPTERRHLFALYDQRVPERPPPGPERVDEPLRRMLDSLTGQPAFVLGRRWDVLAWNRAAEVVYGPYGRLEGDERNMLHMVFADPDHRRLLVDWEAVARLSLAMFRRIAHATPATRISSALSRFSCARAPSLRAGGPSARWPGRLPAESASTTRLQVECCSNIRALAWATRRT